MSIISIIENKNQKSMIFDFFEKMRLIRPIKAKILGIIPKKNIGEWFDCTGVHVDENIRLSSRLR